MKYKVTIRVVETMSAEDTAFKSFEFATEYVVENMLSITGGATVDAVGVGYWKDANGVTIKEKGVNVWTITEATNINPLRAFAQAMCVYGKQDCVLFTVEKVDAEFISPSPEY